MSPKELRVHPIPVTQHTLQHNRTMENGYPKGFINSCIPSSKKVKENNKNITLPYIRKTSEVTERMLKPLGV